MDDVPSPPVARSTSEREARATSDKPLASAASDRGIYDVGSRFGPIYREIARGVKDALGKRGDRDDWWDLLQDIAGKAWSIYCSDPEYFDNGKPRQWASHAAFLRRLDRERNERRRAFVNLALSREFLAGHFDAKPLDLDIEEQERRRAIASALRLLPPKPQWTAIEVHLRGRSYEDAAAELGMSVRAVKRSLEKARRRLAEELSDWDPRAARSARAESDRESHALLAPAADRVTSRPITEGGDHE